ncbi:MAG: hypothetical protein U5K71_14745 [Gracilimonas sp.]|nr:hypothetical protein [Gracilimonas sp.]
MRESLKEKIRSFNPELPKEQVDEVIKELSKDRSSMHPIRANKELYDLMREGVDVEYRGTEWQA